MRYFQNPKKLKYFQKSKKNHIFSTKFKKIKIFSTKSKKNQITLKIQKYFPFFILKLLLTKAYAPWSKIKHTCQTTRGQVHDTITFSFFFAENVGRREGEYANHPHKT